MLFLKDIVFKDGILKCRYSPEHSEQYGYMEVDVETEEYLKLEYSEYEEGKGFYARHAKAALMMQYRKKGPLPSETKAVFF